MILPLVFLPGAAEPSRPSSPAPSRIGDSICCPRLFPGIYLVIAVCKSFHSPSIACQQVQHSGYRLGRLLRLPHVACQVAWQERRSLCWQR